MVRRSTRRSFCSCTVGLSGDPALCVGGQALAQPHLLPRGVGDRVPKPAVGNFMNDVDDQKLIALQNGRDDEGQAWVFHGNNREGWRKKNDVISKIRKRRQKRKLQLEHTFSTFT